MGDPGREQGHDQVADHGAVEEARVVDVVDLVVVAEPEDREQPEGADREQFAGSEGQCRDGRYDGHQRREVAVLAGEEVREPDQQDGEQRGGGPPPERDVLEVGGEQGAALPVR